MSTTSRTAPPMRLGDIYRVFILPHVRKNCRMYVVYGVVMVLSQLLQTLLLPRLLAHLTQFRAFSADTSWLGLGALSLVTVLLNGVKGHMEAVLPVQHTMWMRQRLFVEFTESFRQHHRGAVPTGVFLSRFLVVPREIRYLFENSLALLPAFLTVFFLMLYFATISLPCALVYIVLLLLLGLFLRYSPARRRAEAAMRTRARHGVDANQLVTEEVDNAEHMFAHAQEDARVKHVDGHEAHLSRVWTDAQRRVVSFTTQIQMAITVIYFAMIGTFLLHFHHHPDQRQAWPTVFLTLSWAQSNLLTLCSKTVSILNTTATVDLYYSTLLVPATKTTTTPVVAMPASLFPIVLDRVCVGTPAKTILDNVSLTIHRHDRILLSGASGSGKSTLFALLTRQLQPERGHIRIHGVSLDVVSVTDLRSRVLYLPQSTMLYDASVYQNILWRAPTDADRIAVRATLREYGLTALLPEDMLDTSVGTLGTRLSHGMRKVILLLRTLWRVTDQTQLVLMDEPFASVDPGTRARFVMPVLRTLAEGRALVVSNHVPLPPEDARFFTRQITTNAFRGT